MHSQKLAGFPTSHNIEDKMKVERVFTVPSTVKHYYQCECEALNCHGRAGCKNEAHSRYRIDDFVKFWLCPKCVNHYRKA